MLTKIINNYLFRTENAIATPVTKDSNRLKLYFGDQKNFPDELSCFYPYLTDMEIMRSERFIKKSDERTYVITHALLNKKISELLQESLNELNIKHFYNKKPYIDGRAIDFNLSHSSDYFAFAISKHQNIFVGVDIEAFSENLDIEPIVNNYFHQNEIRYVLNGAFSRLAQCQRFYEIWTRKEAFLKMLGIGLSENLSELDMSPGEREIIIQDNNCFDSQYFSNTYIYTLNLSRNLVLSLSINRPVSNITECCERF